MSGRTGPYVRELEKQMQTAAQKLDYERAARLRDDIAALKKVIEANAVVLPDATNADVFALVRDELGSSHAGISRARRTHSGVSVAGWWS